MHHQPSIKTHESSTIFSKSVTQNQEVRISEIATKRIKATARANNTAIALKMRLCRECNDRFDVATSLRLTEVSFDKMYRVETDYMTYRRFVSIKKR